MNERECVQCGESYKAVRASQRLGGEYVLHCAIVDYEGDCLEEFPRHRFALKGPGMSERDEMDGLILSRLMEDPKLSADVLATAASDKWVSWTSVPLKGAGDE